MSQQLGIYLFKILLNQLYYYFSSFYNNYLHNYQLRMKCIDLQSLRITNTIQKLGVKGRSQAVVELLRMGELQL